MLVLVRSSWCCAMALANEQLDPLMMGLEMFILTTSMIRDVSASRMDLAAGTSSAAPYRHLGPFGGRCDARNCDQSSRDLATVFHDSSVQSLATTGISVLTHRCSVREAYVK
mmetsp:Transcript_60889/g.154717  ORF Transcript_60889/g.154717 Transcript_60889/m.154717 type:complete len:112 (-) Transcript_60889:120-455(-)